MVSRKTSVHVLRAAVLASMEYRIARRARPHHASLQELIVATSGDSRAKRTEYRRQADEMFGPKPRPLDPGSGRPVVHQPDST